jgi:hypothetical protein
LYFWIANWKTEDPRSDQAGGKIRVLWGAILFFRMTTFLVNNTEKRVIYKTLTLRDYP